MLSLNERVIQHPEADSFRDIDLLLRLRIREGRRFTIMDLDPETAAHGAGAMSDWTARSQPSEP